MPDAKSRDFYCSGQRQNLLDQIVEFSLYSNAMIAVTGPLGAGKTTLATNLCDRFADEAVVAKVAATLFMNQSQFLEMLQGALGFKFTDSSDSNSSIEQICRYAAELDLEASSLILIIDDAHELSDEVLHLLTKLLVSCVNSSIHALLFGENQLDSVLQSTLTVDAKERLAVFPLDGFASDETQEYIRFKLATARFTKELPIDVGIVGAIHNSSLGMPGAINNLVVDALNAAAPARERDEFADIGPIYSSDRIAQDDEHEEIEALDGSNPDVKISPLVSIQPRYWFAAATLVVILAGTLLFGERGPRETESIPIIVAVTPKTAQAIEVEPATELPAAVSEQPAAVEVAVAELEKFPVSEVADFDKSNSVATSPRGEVADSVPLPNHGAEINESLLVVPAEVAGPVVEIAAVSDIMFHDDGIIAFS